VHGVEDLGAVVSNAADVANSHYYAFENYEALLVLECLPSHLLGPDNALAVFTLIAVRVMFSALRLIS
jgi:hypothetical protein